MGITLFRVRVAGLPVDELIVIRFVVPFIPVSGNFANWRGHLAMLVLLGLCPISLISIVGGTLPQGMAGCNWETLFHCWMA